MTVHQNKILLHLTNKLKTLSTRSYALLAVFWTGLTLYLSLISAKAASEFKVWDIIGIDKIAHLGFYTIFSFLWMMVFRSGQTAKKIVLIFSVSFGILMEICQFYLLNGRSFEFYDILANIVGSIIGVILFKKCIN